jgi:hypothetical protein
MIRTSVAHPDFWTIVITLATSLLPWQASQGEVTRTQDNTTTIDLKPLWDTARLCANPHKGWYHHYYDNGTHIYPIREDADLLAFPGMDHLYVRLSWRHFEPEEGKFDWSRIDDLATKWTAKGLRIAVRVTSKEPSQIVTDTYATPEWVAKAGARGTMHRIWERDVWVPDYGDPVFLEKLAAFHRAFAKRYANQPWLAYVDVGSIGTWGEGHEWPAGEQPTVAVVKKHLDLFREIYPKALLVVSDDVAHKDRPNQDELAIRSHVEQLGIAWRDDTPLVAYFIRTHPETSSVVRPDYFKKTYPLRPVILECDHYPHVKREGDWVGRNGVGRGADILRGAMRVMRPTYIGYHGLAEEWLSENPELAVELANWCGYWYFPETLTAVSPLRAGTRQDIAITWQNRGLAPAYHRYTLELRLRGPATHRFEAKTSDNRKWAPDDSTKESYTLEFPADLPAGNYELAVRMTDPASGRFIQFGLKEAQVDPEGFHTLCSLEITR